MYMHNSYYIKWPVNFNEELLIIYKICNEVCRLKVNYSKVVLYFLKFSSLYPLQGRLATMAEVCTHQKVDIANCSIGGEHQ